uniref:Ubiquitin-like protease family profile domain-containing protein n=1 Tax=Alexandrium monilatum TaxID=311494 RepID=A0A7S4T4Q2_9DINO
MPPSGAATAAAAALAAALGAAACTEAESQRQAALAALAKERAQLEVEQQAASLLASSPEALDQALRQKLDCGSGGLAGVGELLQMLPEEARACAMQELRAKTLREAEFQVQRTSKKLGALTDELEALAFQEKKGKEEPCEADPVAAQSAAAAAAAAAAVAALEKPCAAVSAGDWARLEEEQYLNDAVLDLFISLMTRALGGPRVHAFSSHFFSRLSSRGARDGLEGWEHVRTWTRGARRATCAGIFANDFLFVPLHHKSNHWSLAVVCRPWAAAECAAATSALGSGTEVVFLNSLGRDVETEALVLHFLRGYLAREWADSLGRHAGSYRSELLAGVPVEVPVQRNDSDCGIFVLEFVLQLLCRPSLLASLGRTQALPVEVGSMPRQRWRCAGAVLRGQGVDEAGVPAAGDWLRLLTGGPAGASAVPAGDVPVAKP